MSRTEYGWDWIESFRQRPYDPDLERTSDPQIAVAFARCFGTPDGHRVLEHLRALTVGRALSPGASDTMLRHLEGQRALVMYLVSMTARGSQGFGAGDAATGADVNADPADI